MKHKKVVFLCAVILLPLLVYLPTLTHELIWDSKPMILENDLLKGEFSLSAPFRSGYWASTSQRSSGYDYYRPLMVLSFMAEKAVWGLNPFRLRLVNLFIFIAGLIVFYLFLSRQTFRRGHCRDGRPAFRPFPAQSGQYHLGRGPLRPADALFRPAGPLFFRSFPGKKIRYARAAHDRQFSAGPFFQGSRHLFSAAFLCCMT